jgi:transcriptional regulator with XRE-family HTH domain
LDDDLKQIADRIRNWRDEAGLTLQKLGDRSGVSASTIHKIENLQTVPTIAVLLKVATGLNRRPSELLEEVDIDKQVAILRRKDRRRFSISEHTRLEHLVETIPRSRLDVWRAHVDAGSGAGRPGTDAWQFQGELMLLVEEGCIEIELGGESHVVEAGDSIHFDSNLSHRWIAGRGKPATLIWFAMIPEDLQTDLMSQAAAAAGLESPEVGEADLVSEDRDAS